MNNGQTIDIFNKHTEQNLFKMQNFICVAILKKYDKNWQRNGPLEI